MDTALTNRLFRLRHARRHSLMLLTLCCLCGPAVGNETQPIDSFDEMAMDAAVVQETAESAPPAVTEAAVQAPELSERIDPNEAFNDAEPNEFDVSRDSDLYTGTDIDYTELNIRTPADPNRYKALQQATQHFSKLFKAKVEWPEFVPGPALTLGDHHPQVALLRQRLLEQGDLPEESFQSVDPSYFDDSLLAALVHFQRRYGLDADGILGNGTRQVLNVPIDVRMQEIQENVKWQRAFAQQISRQKEYIHINIPRQQLDYVKDRKRLFRLPVTVGKVKTPTKVQSGKIEYIAHNPHWIIPEQVAFKRILPRAIDDRGYLDRNGIQVVASNGKVIPSELVEWYDLYNGANPLKLRLKTGANNPYGRYKLRFAKSGGYMTDSGRSSFGSGSPNAVVIKEIRPLVNALLAHSSLNARQLRHLPKSRKTRNIKLKNPIPVHVTYFTAEVDDRGVLTFHPDVYQRFALKD